ncbi:MAG: D-alanyl-D-alanine carboxypeptidase family protein [Oscillospiraceae bacterium]
MRKAKIFSLFLSIILLCSTLCSGLTASAAFVPKFDIHSEAVYMVNLDTDIVIVSKNADAKMIPASTTKIMTALVALENIKDFNQKVELTYASTNEFASGVNPNYVGASGAGLEIGQTLTYWDCLYSLMIASACESANLLAINIAGSIPEFVDMMNAKAAEIGCKNTHFSNTHGLYDPDNYTSAYDLYLITRYAMDNYPGFMTICDSKSYDMPANSSNPSGYTIYNTNKLMSTESDYYFEGVHGIKTGSFYDYYEYKNGGWDTDNPHEGVRALVSTCTSKGSDGRGYSYLLVTLGAPYHDENGDTAYYSFADHVKLYDWAYNEFVYTNVVKANEQVTQADVYQGKNADKVGVCAADDYYTLLEKSLNGTTVSKEINLNEDILPLQAPFNKGYEVGELVLKLNDETLATVPLITEAGVDIDVNEFYIEKIKQVMSNPMFGWIVALSAVEIVLLIVTHYMKVAYRRKVAQMNRRRKLNMSQPKKGGRRY